MRESQGIISSRLWRLAAVGAAVAFTSGVALGARGFGSGGVSSRVGSAGAAVWVAKSGEGGSDSCTRASPPVLWADAAGHVCDQIATAVSKSRGGDTIQLKGGTYSSADDSQQRAIAWSDTRSLTDDVTISPAPGEPVVLAQSFLLQGSHVHLLGDGGRSQHGGQNFSIYNLALNDDAKLGLAKVGHNNRIEGMKLFAFQITAQHHVSVVNSEVGPAMFCYGVGQTRVAGDPPATVCPDAPPDYPFYVSGNIAFGSGGSGTTEENKIGPDGGLRNSWPHHITLAGLYIRDQTSSDIAYTASFHAGGLFLISGHHLVLRDSRFERNVVYNIQVQDFTNEECCGQVFGPFHHVTIENNLFGHPVNAPGQPGTVEEPPGCGATFACRTNAHSDNQASIQMGPKTIENIVAAPRRNGYPYWVNWTFRNNVFQGPAIRWGWSYLRNPRFKTPTFRNVLMVGNVGGAPDFCKRARGLTFRRNRFVGGGCGG